MSLTPEIVEKAREGACWLLHVAAFSADAGLGNIVDGLGWSKDNEMCQLALESWVAVAPYYFQFDPHVLLKTKPDEYWDLYRVVCGEAESLLQLGWKPGEDPDAY